MTSQCPTCGEPRASTDMHHGNFLPQSLVNILQRQHPHWSQAERACRVCINQAKAAHLQQMLETKTGRLSPLESEFIANVANQTLVAANANEALSHNLSPAEQIADRMTAVIGSWYFSFAILLFLLVWVGVNVWLRPFDPYPVIILAVISAALGSLAALHGPIILMSQRRLGKQDRLRADNEYRVNLKAELEIQYLHEKIDRLMHVLHPEDNSNHPTGQ